MQSDVTMSKKGGKPCIEQSIKIYQLFNNDVTLYEMQLMIKQDYVLLIIHLKTLGFPFDIET